MIPLMKLKVYYLIQYHQYHKQYIAQYSDNYLSKAPYYSDNDKRYRYIRDNILKKDYLNSPKYILLKTKY